MNELVSPLQRWLARKQPGLPFFDPAKSIPKLELGGFVAFDAAIPVHEACLSLEFVTPLTDAEKLLRSIEAQLIYELQPALNTQHRKRYNAAKPLMLHIQNFSSDLMNDRFLYEQAGI